MKNLFIKENKIVNKNIISNIEVIFNSKKFKADIASIDADKILLYKHLIKKLITIRETCCELKRHNYVQIRDNKELFKYSLAAAQKNIDKVNDVQENAFNLIIDIIENTYNQPIGGKIAGKLINKVISFMEVGLLTVTFGGYKLTKNKWNKNNNFKIAEAEYIEKLFRENQLLDNNKLLEWIKKELLAGEDRLTKDTLIEKLTLSLKNQFVIKTIPNSNAITDKKTTIANAITDKNAHNVKEEKSTQFNYRNASSTLFSDKNRNSLRDKNKHTGEKQPQHVSGPSLNQS